MTATRQQIDLQLHAQPRRSVIDIGHGLISTADELIAEAFPKAKQALILSDESVFRLYGPQLKASLSSVQVTDFCIPAGEPSKTLANAERVFALLQAKQFSRHDVLIALGGGVVGDLAGFCAALYKRGMQLMQIPTTLLAMVDSSVGGKTAVNMPALKNGIGAFYQPHRVLIDPDLLISLPKREYLAGMAEVIKYALIEDNCLENSSLESNSTRRQAKASNDLRFFEQLQQNLPLDEMIYQSCQFKTAVVRQDEHETTGLRAVLNLGHTFAHALEEDTHYKTFLHGEAVAFGMLAACRLSESLQHWPKGTTQTVEKLYQQLGLALTPSALVPGFKTNPPQLLELMRNDKKNTGNRITLVLPTEKIGKVTLTDQISDREIVSVLDF